MRRAPMLVLLCAAALLPAEQKWDLVLQTGTTSPIMAAHFLPGGKRVILGGTDGQLTLWDIPTGLKMRRFADAPNWISFVEVSPDGTTLFAGAVGEIAAWDIATGKPAWRHSSTDGYLSADISPDGRQIATLASGYRGAREQRTMVLGIIESSSGKEAASISVPVSQYAPRTGRVVFAPDGKSVFVDLNEGRTLRWRPGNSRLEASSGESWERDEQCAWNLQAAASRSLLASQRERSSAVNIWKITDGQPSLARQIEARSPVTSVSLSQDGRLLATISYDGVDLWETETGRKVQGLPEHTPGLKTLCLSPDGSLVLEGMDNGVAQVYETATGRLTQELKGFTSPVTDLSFSPAGDQLLLCSRNGAPVIWKLFTREVEQIGNGEIGATTGSFSPDGRFIALAGRELVMWNPKSQKSPHAVWNIPQVARAVVAPNGQAVVSAESEGNKAAVRMRSAKNGKIIWTCFVSAPIESLSVSRDGAYVLAAMNRWENAPEGSFAGGTFFAETVLIETATGNEIWRYVSRNRRVHGAVFSPGNDMIALSSSSSDLWEWTDDGRPVRSFWSEVSQIALWGFRDGANLGPRHVQVSYDWPPAIAFAPDGRSLATGRPDGIRLWSWQEPDFAMVEKSRLVGDTENVGSLCFSPDGSLIASGSSGSTVRLCNLQTGAAVRILPAGSEWVALSDAGDISWSSNGGQYLAAVCGMELRALDPRRDHPADLKSIFARVGLSAQ
jgi:WD40 repeat protein